jgi:Mce-associated membrane protein
MKEPGGTAVVSTDVDARDVEEHEETAAEPGAVTDEGRTDPPPARRWPRVVAAVLAVALLVAGGVLFAQGRALRDTPATANRALTDSEATTRVAGDVSNALGKVFSYSPQATAVTKESAKQLLAGKALQQYAALFGQVEKQAADQKLTLTTHVVRAGVTRLTENSAHLLVFLDQVYEREGKPATTAAAQLSVTAELRDGHWTVVEIASR